jgi:mannosyl-oligosaccharide alpha-1,2-mannosidase
MPETFHAIPCSQFKDNCDWSYNKWVEALHGNHASHHLKKDGRLTLGFYDVIDGRYLLRPEAIESVFILYRITGDKSLRESGWKMFESIIRATKTAYGHSAIDDVTITSPGKLNNMESFWTAETLKYFYLLFADENVISLDDYVFNTEAHPLSRKTVSKSSWFGSWSK